MTTVLSGTSEDLRSYHALKVLAVATKSGIRLKTKELSSKDEVCALSPLAKSIVLSISDNGNDHVVGGSSSNVMRALASLDPLSSLNGSSDVEKAQVDSWVSYGTSSIEVCIEALKASQSSLKDNDKDQKQIVASIAKDFQFAISVINCHVMYATFMVGNRVTTADIALCSALKEAASVQLWDPDINSEDGLKDEKTVNICRWYNTLLNQDFMAQALSGNASNINNNTDNHTLPGVRLNGNAPPVQNKLYKRSRIRIKEVLANDGANFLNQEISVAGWTKTVRNKGRILFIELNDGSTGSSLQCLCIRDETAGFDQAKKSGGTGSSLRITGKIVPSQGEQSLELQATHCELLGAVYGGDVMGNSVGGANYPMSKKEHSLEHMRQHAHLRPRAGVHAAAMRIRHAMAYATHKFFHDHGFLYIHTPIITCADCEGAGEQFGATTLLGADHLKPGVTLPIHAEKKEGEDSQATDESGEPAKISKKEQKRRAKKLAKAKPQEDSLKPVEVNIPGAVDYTTDFFGKRANLTVSGQLNVETHACALSDVYTFGPTFRAENSHTARHLAEFWMIEPEIAFATLEDDINLAEDYLKYCVEYALEMCKDDLEFFENSKFGEVGLRDRLRNVLENPFKRLTYTEAIEILEKAYEEQSEEEKFEVKPEWGIDLPSEHERYLCEKVYKKPVVLTNYPKGIKAFYMKLDDDEKTVSAADILVPKIGEIIGGSQREHRKDVLIKRCIESGLDPKHVWWYIDLRKYGTIPHAGFGLGFERLILFITGLDNIRDVIPFPRWQGNADF